jgi:hypothetical protein
MHQIFDPRPAFPPNPGSTTEVCYASQRAVGPNLPGDDGRTRKSYNSSCDSVDFSLDGFREEDLRAGGPCLCPLPVSHPALPRSNLLRERIFLAYHRTRYQVHYILQSRGIDSLDISYKLNCARAGNIRYAVPTVNIKATRHSLDKPWLETAREIYTFLASRGFAGFAVDIADPALACLQAFPLLHADLAETCWPEAARLIAEHTDEEVLTVNIFRVGYRPTQAANPPTVVVAVCEESQRDWKMCRERLVGILDYCELFHVAVSIIQYCPRGRRCPFCGCVKC